MSWLFSQALVAEYSAATCSDGAPSVPLSVMPTPHKFWRNDKTMEPSQLSRFGLTCAVLTEDHGAELLTWFRAGFPARTFPPLVPAPALMANAPGSGEKWRESSARYDLDSSTWKTHRCLWDEDLPWSSVTLPKWGMTRNGALFQHPTLERPISASAAGLWPTPTASACKGSSPGALLRKNGRSRINDRLDHALMHQEGGQLNPPWVEWLMSFPIGWTELKPLEMHRFQEWQQQHSIS